MAQDLLWSGASDSEVTLEQRFTSNSFLCSTDPNSMELLSKEPLRCDGQSIGNVNEILPVG